MSEEASIIASPSADYCGPQNEAARLRVIEEYDLDSLEDDDELNRLRRFAAQLCGTEISLVSLVERARQRFLSREGLDATETPREVSFCQHAMVRHEVFVVPDATADPQFADNALVTGEPNIRFYAGAPLVSAEGAPMGALCVISDTPRPEGLTPLQTDGLLVLAQAVMRRLDARRREVRTSAGAKKALRALEDSQRQFDDLADAIPQMAWSTDADGKVDYFNARWWEFTGATPGEHDGDGWTEAVHPDDRDDANDVWRDAVESGAPYEVEYRLRRADGAYRWTLARGVPVKDDEGRIIRWFGTNTDIHEKRELIEKQELLTRELNHRIKNIFSVITGLVSFASRNDPSVKPFSNTIRDRINALGRAHNYVRPMSHLPVNDTRLSEILADLFSPYTEEGREARIRLDGGAFEIQETAVTPIALIFHELATNAVKYGALSTSDGHVELVIAMEGDDVAMLWKEVGGPVVREPEGDARGFGSDLLEMSAERQLGGSAERHWDENGLRIDIRLPAARLVR